MSLIDLILPKCLVCNARILGGRHPFAGGYLCDTCHQRSERLERERQQREQQERQEKERLEREARERRAAEDRRQREAAERKAAQEEHSRRVAAFATMPNEKLRFEHEKRRHKISELKADIRHIENEWEEILQRHDRRGTCPQDHEHNWTYSELAKLNGQVSDLEKELKQIEDAMH